MAKALLTDGLFLQQVKTIAAPTQTVPWVRDVGVRMVHTVERLRLYGSAGGLPNLPVRCIEGLDHNPHMTPSEAEKRNRSLGSKKSILT